jgi:transcriptional regulator with XRE-family HTH domain
MPAVPVPSTSELVALNVRRLRQRLDISQTALAIRMGVAPARISELEHGHSGISGSTLDKLADALECQPQELLMQPNQSPPVTRPTPTKADRRDSRKPVSA